MENLLDRDDMTQQISPTESVSVIDLLADFAERSRGIVVLIMKSLNYYSLKLLSSHAQSQHKRGLLRLWTCLMAYDPQIQEDHLQNLSQFLFSFLRRDADMHPTDEDILRVEFLLTLACFTKNSARIRLRDSEVHKLIRKHLRSPLWKLRCWTCLLLSQLCFECNELKEFLMGDLKKSLLNRSQSCDLLELLSNPHPEVRAAALLLLESFVGFGSSGYQGTRNNIHVYLNHDELNKLVDTEDSSAHFDQLLLARVYERVSMNRECSVLVRRELMRLILKVFCRRCHMAHMICFVDRVLKGEMDVARLSDLLDADRRPAAAAPGDFTPFYVKFWILFLYLRDAEPNLTIRNAVSHYVYIICKNVDYLKSSGTLPTTRSIFELAPSLPFGSPAKSVSTASLPTLPTQEPSAPLPADLPLISTAPSRHGSLHRNAHTSHHHLPTLATGSTVSTVSTVSTNLPTVATGSAIATVLPTILSGSTVSPVSPVSPVSTNLPTVPTVSTGPPTLPTITTGPSGPSGSTVSPVSTVSGSVGMRGGALGPRRWSRSSMIPAGIAQSSSFANLQLVQQGSSSPEPASHIDSMLETQLGLLGLPHTLLEWSLNSFMEWKDDAADERREKRRRLRALLGEESPLDCSDAADYARLAREPRGCEGRRWRERSVLETQNAVGCAAFHPLFSTLAVSFRRAFHLGGRGKAGAAVRLPRAPGDAADRPAVKRSGDGFRVDQCVGDGAARRGHAKRGHFYLGPAAAARRLLLRRLPRLREGAAARTRRHAGDGLSVEPGSRSARNRGDDAACEGLESGDRAARALPRHRRGDARRVDAVLGGRRVPLRHEERPRAGDRHAHSRCAPTAAVAAERRQTRRPRAVRPEHARPRRVRRLAAVFRPAKRGAAGVFAVCNARADVAAEPAGALDAGHVELAVGAARDGLQRGNEADCEGEEGIPNQAAGKRAGNGDPPAERRGGVL